MTKGASHGATRYKRHKEYPGIIGETGLAVKRQKTGCRPPLQDGGSPDLRNVGLPPCLWCEPPHAFQVVKCFLKGCCGHRAARDCRRAGWSGPHQSPRGGGVTCSPAFQACSPHITSDATRSSARLCPGQRLVLPVCDDDVPRDCLDHDDGGGTAQTVAQSTRSPMARL